MAKPLYQAVLDLREELKELEVDVPTEYKNGVKNRVYPQKCFDKSFDYMKENGELPNVKYVEGIYEGLVDHAWVEIDNKVVFEGTTQRFYDKEQYYQKRRLVKLVELDEKGMWKYLFQYQIGNGKPMYQQAKDEFLRSICMKEW
ncbi:hypothetical protein [Vagococcus xieshaowenii]|uniref:Uncharacterized protein n=1 Tax=Vagococcus xieshaowenii TaxID=2562451 RepID=A0AAJ5EG47_9ENTE|nr:hypothetical protein [Vagococcus xieshaowenii]QCA28898.1 hypothetical protein E4Z98_06030 [Vagococcus xieshaowenii]TFZ43316.1 hypothetical protein E4031_00400 [Vagococcus xieshaowenii]